MQQMMKMVNSTTVYYPHQIKAFRNSPLYLHNNSRHVLLPYEDKTFKVQLGCTYVILRITSPTGGLGRHFKATLPPED